MQETLENKIIQHSPFFSSRIHLTFLKIILLRILVSRILKAKVELSRQLIILIRLYNKIDLKNQFNTLSLLIQLGLDPIEGLRLLFIVFSLSRPVWDWGKVMYPKYSKHWPYLIGYGLWLQCSHIWIEGVCSVKSNIYQFKCQILGGIL